MGRKSVLNTQAKMADRVDGNPWRWVLAMALFGWLLIPTRGMARDSRDQVFPPLRLTAGAAAQLMGQLGPDGETLFYMSDRLATWQIHRQSMDRGAPSLLFENDADATDPRISPDGTQVLYISYKTDATGDPCVFDLSEGSSRCFSDAKSSESDGFWFPDGRHFGVLTRSSLHGDFALVRYDVADGSREVLLRRNLSRPAVSPDGRWLIYVPVQRRAEVVGINFARRTEGSLELLPLEDLEATPLPVRFELPGITAFPAFSPDGRHLYFAQYLNDTTFDGVIDGDDHSVLFRVPFRTNQPQPIAADQAEQLSSARWNCQYPAPAQTYLIATCAHEGSLDIYRLPLEGSVPSRWGTAKLQDEMEASRDHWQKLLLLSHRVGHAPDLEAKLALLRTMIRLHLELGEYESAEFYAEQVRREGEERAGIRMQMGVLLALIQARREESRLNQGALSLQFIQSQRARIAQVEEVASSDNLDLAALSKAVLSELYDVLGAKRRALETARQIDLPTLRDPFVIHLAGGQQVRLFRSLEQQDARLETLEALASHPALSILERLIYAERFIKALTGSAPEPHRGVLLDGWLEAIPGDSELGLMLEVARILLVLSPANQEQVRKDLFEIYKENKELHRRKALVLAVIRRAVALDNPYIVYEFANSWVSWLPRAHSERSYGEDLFRQVLLERAYLALDAGEASDARGLFYGVTLQTESLEAHVGFVEARMREGRLEVEAEYDRRFQRTPEDPAYHFVKAYLIARGLADQGEEAFEPALEAAFAHLSVTLEAIPRSLEAHQLWAFLAHQRYLRTQVPAAAQEANTHYLLALDLARERPRYQATILLALGLLQGEAGNHRVALDYFRRRALLPFRDPAQALAMRLARGRSLFHSRQAGRAADELAEAVRLVDETWHSEVSDRDGGDLGGLHGLLTFVLDRAGLYHYAAGRYQEAFDYYLRLNQWVETGGAIGVEGRSRSGEGPPMQKARGPAKSRMESTVEEKSGMQATGGTVDDALLRTRVRWSAMLGATAQKVGDHGRALKALAQLEVDLEAAATSWTSLESLRGKRYVFAEPEYRALLFGLRANSLMATGDFEGARDAMQKRIGLLEAQLANGGDAITLLALAGEQRRLEFCFHRLGELEKALDAAVVGWGYWTRFSEETGTVVSAVSLQLLRDFAALHLYGKLPLNALEMDLEARLQEAYDFICVHPNPAWGRDRFLLAFYLSWLELE